MQRLVRRPLARNLPFLEAFPSVPGGTAGYLLRHVISIVWLLVVEAVEAVDDAVTESRSLCVLSFQMEANMCPAQPLVLR